MSRGTSGALRDGGSDPAVSLPLRGAAGRFFFREPQKS